MAELGSPTGAELLRSATTAIRKTNLARAERIRATRVHVGRCSTEGRHLNLEEYYWRYPRVMRGGGPTRTKNGEIAQPFWRDTSQGARAPLSCRDSRFGRVVSYSRVILARMVHEAVRMSSRRGSKLDHSRLQEGAQPLPGPQPAPATVPAVLPARLSQSESRHRVARPGRCRRGRCGPGGVPARGRRAIPRPRRRHHTGAAHRPTLGDIHPAAVLPAAAARLLTCGHSGCRSLIGIENG